jgi:murein DD-endopeptidase MepM/ murein hydrolase activator NlpD
VRKKIKALLAAVLAVSLLCLVMIPSAPVSEATSTSDLQAQIKEAQQKINDAQDQIDELKSQKASVQASADSLLKQVNALDTQIDAYNSSISLLDQQISVIQKQIDEKEAEIAKEQVQVDATQELLGKRMRAMYMAGESSNFEILLSSGSFAELLTRLELLTNVSQQDNALINKLEKEIKEIKASEIDLNNKKTDLNSDKATLVTQKSALTTAKADLDTKMQALNNQLSSLSSQTKELQEYQAVAQKQEDAYAAELYKTLNLSSGSGVISGGLTWPLALYSGSYITSYFGEREQIKNSSYTGQIAFHKAVDMSIGVSNPYLVAGADGTVVQTSNNGSYNGGYGNYIVIDYGNGVSTLYGHCRSILVSPGESVSRGEKVAIMGSTGNSTGPHTHVEVRISGKTNSVSNDSRFNPLYNPYATLNVPSGVYVNQSKAYQYYT